MQFDGLDFQFGGGVDLGGVGVEEQTHRQPGVLQFGDGVADLGFVGDGVEAALGREFFTLFRHQHRHVGRQVRGEVAHRGGRGHLQVEPGLHDLPQRAHVPVLDVAAVLPQVHGDPRGAAQFRQHGGVDGVGFRPQPGPPDGGDVVDVDVQGGHGGESNPAGRRNPRGGGLCARRPRLCWRGPPRGGRDE